mmetsp:Transcript_26622/g.50438  ORF Transcript_26622/g.50438 Transcript_26622/m.50438 type:complete len:575 (-) Transcript_26622:2051-3775(-)
MAQESVYGVRKFLTGSSYLLSPLLLLEDSSSVRLEGVIGSNAAADRSAGEDLGLHIVRALDGSVLADVVQGRVLNGDAASGGEGGGVGGAGLADAELVAGASLPSSEVGGLVDLAGLVRDAVLLDVAVGGSGHAALAGSSSVEVDEDLGGQVDDGSLSSVHDVEAIGEGGRNPLCPAAAAVLRDVLVLVPGDKVGAVDIAPVEGSGEVVGGEVGVGKGGGDVLRDALVTGGLEAAVEGKTVGIAGLSLDSLLERLVAGVLPALVVLLGGDSPLTVRLDAEVVGAPDDLEEAGLAPVLSPGVPSEPVVGAVLVSSVPDQRDRVVHLGGFGGVLENAASVILEVLGDSDGAGDGATLELLHHGVGSVDEAELLDAVGVVLALIDGGADAGAVGAVHADVDGVAGVSDVVARGGVELAGLLRDSVVVDVGVDVDGVSSVAAVISADGVAVEHHLGGEVDLLTRAVSTGEPDAVGKGGGGSEDVAAAAVVGDVLVAHGGGVAPAALAEGPVVQLLREVPGGRLGKAGLDDLPGLGALLVAVTVEVLSSAGASGHGGESEERELHLVLSCVQRKSENMN